MPPLRSCLSAMGTVTAEQASAQAPRVAIVGGGLAGLTAAAGLVEHGFQVELFEARRELGGRATSFRDPASGELVDHCQHVSMRCCTNLADLCRRTGTADAFRRIRVLHFFGPDGRRGDLSASRWLPAPLHLAPALFRLHYLSLSERLAIARAMLPLARGRSDELAAETIGDWLRRHGQSPQAIERFWAVVLVSALGESLDRASALHARKVFVDGFMAHATAYEVEVPEISLGELYGRRIADWLTARGCVIRLGSNVRGIDVHGGRASGIRLDDGAALPFDAVICAVTWRRIGELFSPGASREAMSRVIEAAEQIETSPITAVHLWFDRSITDLSHAVLVGTLAQWVFNRGRRAEPGGLDAHYYQAVISASRDLAGRDRDDVIRQVQDELSRVWPAAREAQLLRARVVTEQNAVFSVRPCFESLRPTQRTPIANLALAGDWTQTGWPSTMEGAVRSGYLAAEAITESLGRPCRLMVDDLPRSWLVRLLLR